METFRLKSMTDFVINKRKELLRHSEYKNDLENYANIVYNYANFLKQPLNLGMFVPCDEDGDILEEPKNYEQQLLNMMTEYNDEVYRYKQAKEKVLFEGFHIEGNKLCYSDFYFGIIDNISNSKVENLLSELPENEMPKLMLSAIKQIGI